MKRRLTIEDKIIIDQLLKLTNKNIIDMMNNINNVKRRSMEYKTPFEIFNNIYGDNITKKLHLKFIAKDEVDLSYKLLIK